MIYLKKYNESNSVTPQEIYEDFLDCFIDLIDNDDSFRKEDLVLEMVEKKGKKVVTIQPLLNDEIPSLLSISYISIVIGYNKSKKPENLSMNIINYYLEESRKRNLFLETLKSSIDRFTGFHKSVFDLEIDGLDIGNCLSLSFHFI